MNIIEKHVPDEYNVEFLFLVIVRPDLKIREIPLEFYSRYLTLT